LRRSTNWNVFVTILLLMFVFCTLCCCGLPTISCAREAARRAACFNNLKQLGVALWNYQDANKHLPLAHTKDAQGKLLHSWRTMILPYMEWQPLFNQLNMNEPWNGPNNQKLTSTRINTFQCLSAEIKPRSNYTNYIVITGPDTLWPEDRPGNLKDIPDGVGNTILAIETPQTDIPWAEPQDMTVQEMADWLDSRSPERIFSWHGHSTDGMYLSEGTVLNVLFADGTVRSCSKSCLKKNLRALVTPNGGEHLIVDDDTELDAEDSSRLNWPWIGTYGSSFLIFLVSSLLLIFWTGKKREATMEMKNGGVNCSEHGMLEGPS
jgi:hypothetical protein